MTAIVNRRRETSPLTSGPGYWLRLGHKALTRPLADELRQRGIAFKHYFYIRTLLEEDGITQVELSERVGMERATVTVVLDTLEDLGIVVRKAHPTDRRKTNVFLTAKGRRMKDDILEGGRDRERRFAQGDFGGRVRAVPEDARAHDRERRGV